MPDGFLAINKDGLIIGGDKIPLKRDQNLFDYVVSRSDLKTLKNAMRKAANTTRQDIEISFQHQDKRTNFFCRIYKYDDRYLIGGWRLPPKLLYFPLNGLTI